MIVSPFPALFCYLCACVVVTSSSVVPSWRNFETLRKSNCSECREQLHMNMVEVLPRLERIKQRIMNEIGRNRIDGDNPDDEKKTAERENEANIMVDVTATPNADAKSVRQKILTYPEVKYESSDETVLKFDLPVQRASLNQTEALGASLLLFVDRTRKIRNGGKGKRIFIEVLRSSEYRDKWSMINVVKTRVKRKRWTRINLPVSFAQKFIQSESKSIELKIKCTGCGRLVKLLFSREIHREKQKRHQRNVPRAGRKPKRKTRRKGPPILIIDTRFLIK
ncbi:uncharacterized protein LOC128236914 [Mya arenaria]|uniref:uncharacterized protein LOC128236914 n=1 Tax=Mya arenaria TaxID=6604 RepID=UPI0022DEBCB6|nr:uncharacterized protein LOC128236914 [Mya arenaria]XP_052808019.1 uncharacterized protein LOC128236914 [Mya arenaria]XP_052808026.1 uncharacterized protein LOC128236914 [Mya arenaria]